MEERPIDFLKYRIRRDACTPMYTTATRSDKDFLRLASAESALRMYKIFTESGELENMVFSPCLIQLPLLPLLAIAEGETRTEIKKALGMENVEDSFIHTRFQYAYYRLNQNGRRHDQWRPHGIKVWDFHPVYILFMEQSLLAPVGSWVRERAHSFRAYENVLHCVRRMETVDLKAMTDLNRFVEAEAGFSNGIMNREEWPEAKLGMVSAIRYEAVPIIAANADRVESKDFNASETMIFATTFLCNTALKEYTEDDHCKAMGIEFCWGNLTLYMFLPKPSITLEQFEDHLTGGLLLALMKRMATDRVHKKYMVTYEVPEFALSQSRDLADMFRYRLGLTTLFDRDQINLKSFLDSSNVQKPTELGCVCHHVTLVVEKNRKGEINRFIRPPRPTPGQPETPGIEEVQFKANRPFLFVVYDTRAELFLFMGRVSNPADRGGRPKITRDDDWP